jgi:hypothetical protein
MRAHERELFQLLTGGNHTPSVSSDLSALDSLFPDTSVLDTWRPPRLSVFGRTKKRLDGLLWMGGPPVVSERARDVLAPVAEAQAEFLPLLKLGDVHYFALHVLASVRCLDLVASGAVLSPTDRHVIFIPRFVFRHPTPRLQLFRASEFPGPVFVARTFMERVVKSELTGIGFGAPEADGFRLVLSGQSQNIVANALVGGKRSGRSNHALQRTRSARR